jgi:hypothetical protein
MPAAGFRKHTYTGPRPWETTDAVPFRDVAQCSRGEQRLAAEIALAELRGCITPTFAHERAVQILSVLALG